MTLGAPPPAAGVYSQIASSWARCETAVASSMARRIVRTLRSGGRVLDVGCGTGALLAAVRSVSPKPHGLLAGVDLAPGMVRRAARRRGIRATLADAHALPFADQVFDVVVGNLVTHLLDDPARAAAEMFRVTAAGGTILVEVPGRPHAAVRRLAGDLPSTSLLRAYLELPRHYGTSAVRGALERRGCVVTEAAGPPGGVSASLLSAIARASGSPEDLLAAAQLARTTIPRGTPGRVLTVRVPGPRRGGMPVEVADLEGWTGHRVRALLRDLPVARGYRVLVKPLRYRTRPHVQAFCEFDEKRIIIQVPVPFRPFDERVPYRAHRVRAKGFRFRWEERTIRFERPDELIRYLYLHEYYHWYLREALGKPSAAETACDRFALQRMRLPTARGGRRQRSSL